LALSLSRTANSTGDLNSTDLLFAGLLHALVLIVILVLGHWQQDHKEEPLKRLEVMMISAKQLATLEQQAHNRPKASKAEPVQAEKKKPEPVIKPVVKPVAKPKPVVKPKPAIAPKPIAKPAEKPAPKAKTVARVDKDFDPFAPVSSSTDHTATHAQTTRPELADLAGKQLSRNEIEHYIALMQAAVQEHWKVPVSSGSFTDPLVEMKLLTNGDIASLTILESSGSELLDASLIRAIRAAAPFQLPAQQFEFFRVNTLRFHPLK